MITPMKRVRIVGPLDNLESSVKNLRLWGGLHIIRWGEDPFLREEKGREVSLFTDLAQKRGELHSLMGGVEKALSLFQRTYGEKKETLSFAPTEKEGLHPRTLHDLPRILEKINEGAGKLNRLEREWREVDRYRTLFETFQPLLERLTTFRGLEIWGILFKKRDDNSVEILKKGLEEITEGAYELLWGGEEEKACLLLYPGKYHEKLKRGLFAKREYPVQRVTLPRRYERDSFASTLLYLFKRERQLKNEIKDQKRELKDMASRWTALLLTAKRGLSQMIREVEVGDFPALSARTFWVSGWTPEEKGEELDNLLKELFGGEVVLYVSSPDPADYEKVPVFLKNRPSLRPFERVLALFPAPLYGSVDPTFLIALFFPLFFGLILGDVGYGLILAVMALIIRKRKGGSALWRDLTSIMGAAALSAIFFGVIYGEFFGKLWNRLGFPPALFHREEETLLLLVFVLFLGGVHLATGHLLAIKIALVRGKTRAGILKGVDLLITLTLLMTLNLVVLGGDWQRGLQALLALALFKLVVGGPLELLETGRLFANFLSYARLMALGLASILLANLADNASLQIEGILWGFLAAAGIHFFNFILGVFSPTIHAVRLHYVEFFAQFYEPGFTRYRPFH